jgi:hypothetical protein
VTVGQTGPSGTGVLGTGVTNASGNASIAVAAPSVPGTYTVTATTQNGACSLSASLALVVSDPGPQVTGDLPSTGGTPWNGARVALAALAIGAALIAVTRRDGGARTR